MNRSTKELLLAAPAPLQLGTYFSAQAPDASLATDFIELLTPHNPQAAQAFGEELNDIQPGPDEADELYPLMDRICDALTEHGPPFSYFGSYEADASWGVWPNRERLETVADDEESTVLYARDLTNQGETFQARLSEQQLEALREDQLRPNHEYIWDGGWANLWDRQGINVWNPY